MIGEYKTNVVLPDWIFDQANDKEHLKRLVLDYMRRYPGYVVKTVKDGFTICTRE
ncbi:hypothetical protein JMM81_12525 [Bacillus sp. V3B]|uniref:hypothetical protein n=1 Tax=Bacillus sp. V3B TaxID=2804915 RepID=UPI002108DBDA|nr:hypothetical protein [Bacillus sp. V3B]MCQ6275780.1 hypothetical protein [Bacillus sp. V3B]